MLDSDSIIPRKPNVQSDLLSRLHPSLRAGFVLLPSDPHVHLTPEQLNSLFAGDQELFVRDLLRLVAKRQQQSSANV